MPWREKVSVLAFCSPLNPISKQNPETQSDSLLELGLPDHVEDVCPLLPSLEQALSDVKQLAGAGAGARQTQYIHVTEVILPMLCRYMSFWWSCGPEGHPDSPMYTSVTPHHASDLLGHVIRIIHNHVGTSQGDWMKQMAGIIGYVRYWCGFQKYFSFSHHYCVRSSQFTACQSYVTATLSF